MTKLRAIDLQPEDRAALNQGKELARRGRTIRKLSILLTATMFVSSTKRYLELIQEARMLANMEATRMYNSSHPKRRKKAR